MTKPHHARVAGTLIFGSAIAVACGTFGGNDTATSDAADGGAADGSDEASAVTGGPSDNDGGKDAGKPKPTVCDLSDDPVDNPLCVTDQYGIFVDGTSGNDTTADGTMKKPWKTIAHALVSGSTKPRIYICAGAYAEPLVLDTGSGTLLASVYGGFTCGTWAIDASKNVVTLTDGAFPALRVKGASKITIADLTFTAAAGKTSDAPNSIAGIIADSAGVTLERVSFSAAAGFTQTKPAAPASNWGVGCAMLGQSPIFNGMNYVGGVSYSCGCVDGSGTTAGGGGNPGANGTPGLTGSAGAAGKGLQQCFISAMNTPGTGVAGSAGNAPVSLDAANHAGALDANKVWLPTNGTSGVNGGAGQGGGGGGGGMDTNVNNAGGGGGAGGCGGAGGAGGRGGGASIGLVVTNSTVAIAGSTFKTAAAGGGADGAQPEPGVTGGNGVSGHGTGCSGAKGGDGAGGKGGGGGAGGVSIGLLFSGTAPTIDGAKALTAKTQTGFTVGTAGTNGKGGTNTACTSGKDGALGISSAVFDAAGL